MKSTDSKLQTDDRKATTATRWTYGADARLTGETLSGYDLDNNRTQETINGGSGVSGGDTIAYTYNGDDELTDEKETASGGSTVYETLSTYDADGNLSTQTTTGANASSSTYGYDLRNRMTSVTTGGQTTTYAYDHTGVLIAETTGGVSTYYLNDPINATGYSKPIQQSSTPGGLPTLSYVLGLSVEAQSDATNGTLYLLSDGHGSTRALTTSTGAVAAGQTFDYSAFGAALDFDPTTAKTVWLFGGDGSQDNASGFTYQLARWRNGFEFTQRDTQAGSNGSPISLGSYVYSGDNAIYGNDPTGHDELDDLGIDTGADDTENDGGDGDLADQAFGLANEDIAEDEAGYDAVDSYVHGQFGNIGAYTAMNFAANDLLAAGTSLDAQAVAITAGMTAAGAVGGVLLEGGVEAFLAADEGAGGGGAESVEDMEQVAEEESEASADCGTEESCFLAGTDVLLGNQTEEQIQDITVGQRVATDGGVANSSTGTAAADPNATEIKNPKNWREITLVAGDWDVETLEPISWITSHHVHDGSRIKLANFLNLKEMGAPANLVGTVEAIGACPAIAPGSGRVVLTTVNHLNDDVYELTLRNTAGVSETLGVTGYHRFYDTVEGWTEVQDLHLGEQLRGADGTLTVTTLTRQPGTYRVYNMTVEADHVYYVGELPALVHNTCKITYGTQHAAPHFAGTAFDQAEVESAIDGVVQETLDGADVSGPFEGRVFVDGQEFEYRGYGLPDGTVNIGTYYPIYE